MKPWVVIVHYLLLAHTLLVSFPDPQYRYMHVRSGNETLTNLGTTTIRNGRVIVWKAIMTVEVARLK